jgi:hypothetical protein
MLSLAHPWLQLVEELIYFLRNSTFSMRRQGCGKRDICERHFVDIQNAMRADTYKRPCFLASSFLFAGKNSFPCQYLTLRHTLQRVPTQ